MSRRVCAPMPSRRCLFTLALQDDSVFADFDLDAGGCLFLRRISYDGYGCCNAPETIGRMPLEDSREMLRRVGGGDVEAPGIEVILRGYFRENADILWHDALTTHRLL